MKQILAIVITMLCSLTVIGCQADLTSLEGISSLDLGTDWLIDELAWSPDGRYLAFTADGQVDPATYVLDLETEVYQAVKIYADRIPHETRGPAWSPDGESLVLFYPPAVVGPPGQPMRLSPFSIVVIDSHTGDLMRAVWDGSYATWGPKQNEIIVVDSDIGRLDEEVPINIVNLDTSDARQVTKTLARTVFIYESLDVSATGFLAFHNDDKLQIVDIASGEEIGAIKEAGRLYSPAWSPDGHILAYILDVEGMSEEGGRPVIYFSTADGLCQSDPLDLGVRVTSIDWSPDAEQLVFSTNEHGRIFFLSVKLGPGKMLLDSYQVNCLP